MEELGACTVRADLIIVHIRQSIGRPTEVSQSQPRVRQTPYVRKRSIAPIEL